MNLQQNITDRQTAEAVKQFVDEHFGELSERVWEYFQALIPKVEKVVNSPAPMNDGLARAFERSRVWFGKYCGDQISDIPKDYLEWLVNEDENFKVMLRRYIASDYYKRRA